MNQWGFVTAAYVLAGLATIILVAWAYFAMRRAERNAEAVRRR